MNIKGLFFTVASALLFGFTPVLASYTYEMGATPETLTFYRDFMALPALLLILAFQRQSLRLPVKTLGAILLIGLFGRGTTSLMLYLAYPLIGIGTTTTLHFLYPVCVALICRIFFRERLGGRKLIALTLAIIGVCCFLDFSHAAAAAGLLIAGGSGLTYAFYLVGIEKFGLKDLPPFQLSFYLSLTVSMGMLLYNIPTRSIRFVLPARAMLILFLISLCIAVLAMTFLQLGIKYLGASNAAIFSLLEPISCEFFGWLLLGEHISPAKLAGCAIILTAAGIMSRAKAAPAEDSRQTAAPCPAAKQE